MKEFILKPPAGMAFNQWADGTIHFQVHGDDWEALNEEIVRFSNEVTSSAIEMLETAKAAETKLYEGPLTKVQKIDIQLKRLRDAKAQAAIEAERLNIALPPEV